MGFGVADYVLESVLHDVFQLLIDHGFFPEIPLPVLHPLEVGGCYTTGIAKNIGNHEDSFFRQDLVSRGRGRTIRALRQNPAFHSVGVATGNLIFGGGWNEYLAVCDQQFGGIDRVSLRKTVNGAVPLVVFPKCLDINSVFPVKPAIHLGDGNHFVTCLGH